MPVAFEPERFDVVALGAHPDDLEVVLGGTAAILVRRGMRVLFVDLCDGEPARHAVGGVRHVQAEQAATILGVHRTTLALQDAEAFKARAPLLVDSPEVFIKSRFG